MLLFMGSTILASKFRVVEDFFNAEAMQSK